MNKAKELEEFITQSIYFGETTLQSEGVSSKVWDKYLSLGRRLHKPKGDIIVNIGENPGGLYFIQKGDVQCNLLSKEDTIKTISIRGERTIVGEQFVFHHQPGIFEVIALKDCELYYFSRDVILNLAQKDIQLLLFISTSLAVTSRMMAYQISDLSKHNIIQSLARILYSIYCIEEKRGFPDKSIIINITHEELANMMGTHRVTVTKYLNHFKALGIVDYKYEKISVINQDKLKNLAIGGIE